MAQEDTDEQHVLIIGQSEERTLNARELVHKVLTADDKTRNNIRNE